MKKAYLILTILVGVLMFHSGAYAQLPITRNDIDRINRGELYRDPDELLNVCSVTQLNNLPAGSTLYILGDSLSVGMESAGIASTLLENQITTTRINALGGRSLQGGRDALGADAEAILSSDAALVGLGTNHVGNVVANDGTATELPAGKEDVKQWMGEIITNIRLINPSIAIYWTNVYITGILTTPRGSFDMDVARRVINEAISEVIAEQDNIQPINWGTSPVAAEVVINDNIIGNGDDGIHPNNYSAMRDEIVNLLTNDISTGVAASSTGCSGAGGDVGPLVGDTNEERVWNYMIARGLQPHQAAGFMGNMVEESNFEPRITEIAYSSPPYRSDTVPLPPNCANAEGNADNDDGANCFPGYGLVQWTSLGRKKGLRDFAASEGLGEGDLRLQLDYVWSEINARIVDRSDMVALYGTVTEYEALLQTQNSDEAAFFIAREYEIPGAFNTTVIRRQQRAREYLLQYQSTVPN